MLGGVRPPRPPPPLNPPLHLSTSLTSLHLHSPNDFPSHPPIKLAHISLLSCSHASILYLILSLYPSPLTSLLTDLPFPTSLTITHTHLTSTSLFTYAHMRTHMHIHIHKHINVHTPYAYTHMCTHTYTRIHTNVCTCIYTCIYLHTLAHTHTHTHMHLTHQQRRNEKMEKRSVSKM